MSHHDETAHEAPTREPIGFQFEVRLQAGLTEAAQVHFQRSTEDYCSSRGLHCSLTQCMGALWCEVTDLTLSDTCEFLCWLERQPNVCGAAVSALGPVNGIEDVEGPQLRLDALSPAGAAGCLLYRLGLIKPDVLARALGGFVQPLYDL